MAPRPGRFEQGGHDLHEEQQFHEEIGARDTERCTTSPDELSWESRSGRFSWRPERVSKKTTIPGSWGEEPSLHAEPFVKFLFFV